MMAMMNAMLEEYSPLEVMWWKKKRKENDCKIRYGDERNGQFILTIYDERDFTFKSFKVAPAIEANLIYDLIFFSWGEEEKYLRRKGNSKYIRKYSTIILISWCLRFISHFFFFYILLVQIKIKWSKLISCFSFLLFFLLSHLWKRQKSSFINNSCASKAFLWCGG